MRKKTKIQKVQEWFSEPIIATRTERAISVFLITALIIICFFILVQSKTNNAKEFHSGIALSEMVTSLEDTIPDGYEAEVQNIKTEYAELKDTQNATETSKLTNKICNEIEALLVEVSDNIDK